MSDHGSFSEGPVITHGGIRKGSDQGAERSTEGASGAKPTSQFPTKSMSGSHHETDELGKLRQLLIDAETANAELGGLLAERDATIAGLERNLRRAAQAETALRNELAKVREEEPESDDVRELLGLWRDEVKAGDKRIKIDISGPRGKQVKWALKKYGKERCTHAILGATLDDWAMGRIRKSGGKSFNDIAKHILHDEETVERFEALWHNRNQPRPTAPQAQVPRNSERPATIEEFASRIEAARQVAANQWEGRCPAHEDRHASLRFAYGDKGLVVTCWAGCTNDHIAQAIGVPLTRWFFADDTPVVSVPARQPEPLPTVEQLERWWIALRDNDRLLHRLADVKGWTPDVLGELGVGWDTARKRLTIPVHGADGALINVISYLPGGKPKSLALRHRPRGLFPAPELSNTGSLWLVEGEPDAITGRQIGIAAVGLPGVNGWRSEWAARFNGRDVVVCFDCDDPGRKAGQTVARDIVAVARSVRVVDLMPDQAAGYDLTDAVLEGATVESLQLLAEACTPIHALRREAA